MAGRLCQLGQVPVGALTLPALDRATLFRKFRQWGWNDFCRYAWNKLGPSGDSATAKLRNPYLETALRHEDGMFRNLHEVASAYHFPLMVTADQNSESCIKQFKDWAPDVAIFTGGNILREEILMVPRLGIINSHLALLPKFRGMSSPEWSLLAGDPLGITIHYMDAGIDTGPVLLRREFSELSHCESLSDLRNRLIAGGIEMVMEVLTSLERGSITPVEQTEVDRDHQYFVMHDRLKVQAAKILKQRQVAALARLLDRKAG